MKSIIAIDPGSEKSALVCWDGKKIEEAYIVENEDILKYLRNSKAQIYQGKHKLIIEQIRCYGMTMGASMIDTVFWSGRFAEVWPEDFVLIPRIDVKMHLCHTSRAKKKNTRQAMIDRFGKPPTKKEPNEIYNGFKIATHLWSAWEMAVTYWDQNK